MKEDLTKYVIVDSRSTCGNSVFFWCHDHKGYTCDLRMAGVYSYTEAQEICSHRETDKMFKLSDVLKLVQHHVDCQDLYNKSNPQFPHTFYHLTKLEGKNE